MRNYKNILGTRIENYNVNRTKIYISTRRYKILVYDISNNTNNDVLSILRVRKRGLSGSYFLSISINDNEWQDDILTITSRIKHKGVRKLFLKIINEKYNSIDKLKFKTKSCSLSPKNIKLYSSLILLKE